MIGYCVLRPAPAPTSHLPWSAGITDAVLGLVWVLGVEFLSGLCGNNFTCGFISQAPLNDLNLTWFLTHRV